MDLGELLASTCSVDVISAQREEPIEKLPFSGIDQDKVVSGDGVALQQSRDSFDSQSTSPGSSFAAWMIL